ncbi:MAG: hypothetical protein M3367_05960 [Acidobacteriota bacterium]|nr:hypothetical protein [Acidobacteriota bacterium]
MKIILGILFSVLILFSGNLVIYGCTCPFPPLDRSFKEAKAVFIGKLSQNNFSPGTEIQGVKNGTVLEVEKSWKGVKGKYFSVTTKFEDWGGMCTPFFKKFEKERKYLIFAEGENFEVRNNCTYSEEIYFSKHPDWYRERQRRLLKRIDKYGNFWFRFGKRIKLI